jgi:ergothioneine biosynthesis protein EgtB
MHATAVDRFNRALEELAAIYTDVRQTTERLCAPLSAEDQVVQSMPDASPAKWHQGHTTWFYETFLLTPHCPGYRTPDPRFRFFFNSYYKRLGGHPVRAQRGLWSRPSLAEIQAYRRHVDEHMMRWLQSGVSAEMVPLIELGCNHEQQHQELILTDIKHALWTNPLHPAYRKGEQHDHEEKTVAPLRWFDYVGGLHWIGHEGDTFAFDNESPRHQTFLQPFRLASRLVTVGEYLEFVRDGGYSRPELWLSEGWDTINAQNWRAPLYWERREDEERRDGDWFQYTLDGERPLNPAEPVCHVSYFEADAYARWAGARLATEFEWEVAATQATPPTQAALGWGTRSNTQPARTANLLDSNLLHPSPANDANDHPHQLFGDVWEWTASPYVGYPGFRPAAGAVGEYNGKFMCNQFVLRGGSCATPANHIRATYRNFFPATARWQFTGIRLAHD